MWKCNSCGGTYADTQPSGMTYMHACPPTVPRGLGAQVPIVNPRDETPLTNAAGRVVDIKSKGAGVTPLLGQTTTEPQWILQLRQAAAAVSDGG